MPGDALHAATAWRQKPELVTLNAEDDQLNPALRLLNQIKG
jgi:predicted nucleic acid-binding protein